MKQQLKQFLPHLAVIAGFVAISVIYFLPAFSGYELNQSDITQYKGMSQEISAFRAEFDEEPLWTNSMFGGMPAYQISVHYPNDIIGTIDKVITLGLPRPANYLFLYLFGFYLLLSSLRFKPVLAAVGAVAFAFASYYFAILIAGHNTKAHAIGYMAPLLAGIIWAYRGKYWLGGGLAALFLALEIDANHVQITYYFGMLVLLYAVLKGVEAMKNQTLPAFAKASGFLVAAAIIGILANANVLLNTYNYGKYTTRGKTELTIKPDGSSNESNTTEGLDRDYVTQWSYGIGESFSYLIPNVKGGKSGALIDQNTQKENPQLYNKIAQGYQATQIMPNSYWGNQPYVAGSVYFGAIVILLFLLGAVFVRGPMKITLVAIAILSMMLSWGSNLMGLTDFFLDYIPGYNKFRAPTIILAITSFTFVLLGFLFLKNLMTNKEEFLEKKKLFFAISGGLLVLLALFLATPTTFFDFFSEMEQQNFTALLQGENSVAILDYMDGMKEVRLEIFRADALRALIFVAIGVALIWFYANQKINEKIFLGVLLVAIVADMWPISKRYLNNEKEKGKYVQWVPKENGTSGYSALQADDFILSYESEQNPRVADAIAEAEVKFKSEQKGRSIGKKNKDGLNDAKFAALRFSTNYRVLPLNGTFQDARVAYFHKSVGGYHGAKLKRIQEFYDFQTVKDISSLMGALQNNPTLESIQGVLRQATALNLLNTKYIIYNPEAPPIENPSALGSAWFVETILTADNADQEIQQVGALDPANEMVVDKRFANLTDGFSYAEAADAAIAVETHLPNYIKYIYDSPVPQATVFSEIYYPEGWKAYLDGEEAEYFRADYILRGMIIPGGAHTIEFKFEPASFQTASMVSTIFGCLAVLFFAFALWSNRGSLQAETEKTA